MFAHHRDVTAEEVEHLPYWDIVTAVDAMPEMDGKDVGALEQFVAVKLARL